MLSDGSDGKPTEQIHLLFISVAKWHLEKLAFGTYTYKIKNVTTKDRQMENVNILA